MKILFCGAHFPRPNNATIGTWALSQVYALRDAGHEVLVISPIAAIPVFLSKMLRRGTSAICPPKHSWDGIEANYIRWPVYPVGPAAKWLRARPGLFLNLGWNISKKRFLNVARDFSPDVVFAHHGQLAGFAAAEIARRLKVPFFIIEHNFNDIASCATNVARKKHYLHVTKDISRWIAVANRMRDSMKQVFPNVPATVIHNGAERLPHGLKDVARPLAFEGRIIVLCVTFFYKRKNVPLLIQAFDEIAANHPNAVLLIGGDGDDRAAIKAAVQESAHGSQIQLLGAMTHQNVLQHMAWCDIFALIGVDEPFGVVFIEAMMAGKPIICCDDGGITDVVVNGIHGLCVAPGDRKSTAHALDRLLSDSAMRKRLGAAARELANAHLTWPGNAEKLTALFAESLKPS